MYCDCLHVKQNEDMDKNTCLHYLKIASAAYKNTVDDLYRLGASNVHFYDASAKKRADVQFFTVEFEHDLVFAIRGSQSMSDFKDDMFCWTDAFQDVADAGARVHSGFLKQYLAMRSAMISAVFRMVWKQQNKRVVFVGHSLGGALATLCGAAVKNELPELHVSVITFGSPRVGNKVFTDAFSNVDVSIRCVNGGDVVPTVPHWGYEHVKGLLSVGNNALVNINDHYLDSYVHAITSAKEETFLHL